MKYRMRSYETNPPGNYFYEQRPPKGRRFGPEPLIEAVAKQVWRYRQGNSLPGATYAESLKDVDYYMANGPLRGNLAFVVPATEGEAQVVPLQADAPGLVPCKGCGAPLPTS